MIQSTELDINFNLILLIGILLIRTKQPTTRTNQQIRASELRVIDENGNQIGVLSRDEALSKSRDAGLDLVEISPLANPPVAKIVDWGKYQYQKNKQQKLQRKGQKTTEVKQIRLSLKISDHDLDTKLNRSRTFLNAGNKVKFSLLYKGRENIHKDLGYSLLDKITSKLQDIAVIDQPPQMAGRNLSIVVKRSTNA